MQPFFILGTVGLGGERGKKALIVLIVGAAISGGEGSVVHVGAAIE